MLLLLANGGGGGGGSPGPLTFADYAWHPYDFTDPSTRTEAGLGIGAAASDRWVIVGIVVNHNTSRSISAVSIGGVSATLLYSAPSLSTDGVTFEFWKANVPTGSTADLSVTAPSGSFWDFAVATYYCTGEPTFYAGQHDAVYTGTTFSVAIDVPEGGAVLAQASNDGAGVLSSWVGATADNTDNTEQAYHASEDQLAAQTGRTVSFTSTVASTSTNFYGLAVLAVSVPAVGGGGATGTASGSLGLTGSALGIAPVAGTGSGTLVLTGSASGAAPVAGTASGSIALTGSSVGMARAAGTSTGDLPLTGSGAGTVTASGVNGVVGGNLPLMGAATGVAPVVAQASGAIAMTGSAAGLAPEVGSASGSLSLTGSASATAPVVGQGSGSLPLSGSATGAARAAGNATGALPLAGASSGTAQARGAAAGTVPLTGGATGAAPVAAVAFGGIAFTGLAAGTVQTFTPGRAAVPAASRNAGAFEAGGNGGALAIGQNGGTMDAGGNGGRVIRVANGGTLIEG